MVNTKHGLLNASASVGSMTMLSRVMGLLRDIVIARFFGASDNADAFFVAFRIPQFLRRLFAEGAFAQAFVPVLAEYRNAKTEQGQLAAVQALVNAVSGVLGGSLLLISALVVMAAPLVTMLFAPGFINQPEKLALTTQMLRITFPYLLLISLTGFAGAILNSYQRFLVPAFTPVLLNFSLIGFALWVSPHLSVPVFALAWAVLFAGFAQLLFQLPFLARLDLLPRPKFNRHHPGVRKILKLMLPAIFGVSVSQINLLLDTVLASFLPSGSVSWLYYSDRLAELPLGVFGIAIATVILPSLSRLQLGASAGGGSDNLAQRELHFSQTLSWALRSIVVVALPATAALWMLAEPILFMLFQYQATTAHDVLMSAASLRAYALGLFAFMAIKVLASAFYAQQDMRTPVKIGVIAMVVNMLLNLLFVALFHRYWTMGHVGLALATACSALLNAGLLYHHLARNIATKAILDSQFWRIAWRVVFATAVMTSLLGWLVPGAEHWQQTALSQRLLAVSSYCVLGLGTYLLVLFASGVRWSDFRGDH